MRQIFRTFLLGFAWLSFRSCARAWPGFAPSMGDVARQARQQKQNKDAQSKTAPASKTPKVITNEEIPEHPEGADGGSASEGRSHPETSSPSASDGAKTSAEQWKSADPGAKEMWSVPCKATSRRSMIQSNLPPATASRAACSGTSARSRNSRK